jgi:iron complex transport system substrate-binding protein
MSATCRGAADSTPARARRLTALAVVALAVWALSSAGGAARSQQPADVGRDAKAATPAPARIICLVPAVTEMLFAIGAGPQVVAVGSFDRYPPEVEKLPRVGALVDPDVERILSLRPDLAVVYGTQAELRQQLDRAGIPQFAYAHARLADVTATIRQLGERVGRADAANRAAAGIEADLERIRQRVAGRPRPRTLLVFGREPGSLRGIFASGGFGFLHDMLEVAGGDNVFADVQRESVQASSELILARRPEAIVEIRGMRFDERQIRKELAAWRALSSVPAVRAGRVHFIADPRTVVPGPRVAEATELLSRVLHPEGR